MNQPKKLSWEQKRKKREKRARKRHMKEVQELIDAYNEKYGATIDYVSGEADRLTLQKQLREAQQDREIYPGGRL